MPNLLNENLVLIQRMKNTVFCFATACLVVFAAWNGLATADTSDQSTGNAPVAIKKRSSNGASDRHVHVSTAIIVSANDTEVSRNYTGTVVAKRLSELGFKRIGRIEELMVDQGDSVEKNQVIGELDTAQIEAQIAVLVAQRKAAIARLDELKAGPRPQMIAVAKSRMIELTAVRDQLKATFDRRNRLANSDAISVQDIDDARQQLAAADARVAAQRQVISELEEGTRKEQIAAQEAEVDRLDASVNALNVDIEESKLRAPFAGRIAKRHLDEGAIVQPGQAIFRLVELDGLEAFIGLPVDVARSLDANDTFSLSVNESEYSASLKAVLPELDPGTRTRTAIFTITNPPAEDVPGGAAILAPGQVIQLRLTQKVRQEGYWVPVSSLAKGVNGLWSIYLIDEFEAVAKSPVLSATVRRTDVEVIQIDTSRVLIRGAVRHGDRVVVDGVQKITPGQTVSFSESELVP
jgi:RND family efflux transporter MFP subunit